MRDINTTLFSNGYDSASIEKDDIMIINQLLKSSDTHKTGTHTDKLEKDFQAYLEMNHAFAFSKGRHALAAILNALQLDNGDEVILPGYTCVVVANSVLYNGLKPVYCDIELDTFGPSLESIKKLVTSKTKVIVTQHTYGLVCRDYEDILSFAKKNEIYIVDDCAQATGAMYKNKKLGYFAIAAFYSLQHSKIITCGDGGIAATNDDSIAKKINIVKIKSKEVEKEWVKMTLYTIKRLFYSNKNIFMGKLFYKYYNFFGRETPININKDEISGAVETDYIKQLPSSLAFLAINQLNKIDFLNQQRLTNAEIWNDWALSNNLSVPYIVPNTCPAYLRYPVLLDEGNENKIIQSFKGQLNIGNWMNSFLTNASPKRQPDSALLPNAKYAIDHIINLPCL
jgi:perosamine synthetase